MCTGNDGGVHADHGTARIDERAAGIAWIQRRIGLDHIVNEPPGAGTQAPPQGTDDSGGDGVFKAQGIADGDRQLPDLQIAAACKLNVRRAATAYPDHRQVRIGIVTEHIGPIALAIEGADANIVRAMDHVTVGEQQPVGRKEESGSGPALLASAAHLAHVKMHHGRCRRAHRPGDRFGIGIQQVAVAG